MVLSKNSSSSNEELGLNTTSLDSSAQKAVLCKMVGTYPQG